MSEDPILQNVRRRAGLPSTDAAWAAVQATFHTLGERLADAGAALLWQSLPATMAEGLQREAPPPRQPFSFDEFCQRLADREGTDVPVAVFHARTVLQVVRESLQDPHEFDRLATLLSNDFAPLFWHPAGAGAAA